MKILIVNYRFFVSGGPERYMFRIMEKLEQEGHEVSVFSVQGDKNEDTPFSRYFVEPVGGRNAVYYEEYRKDPKTVLQLVARSCYSLEVKKAIQREIREIKPDIVYIIHFVNKLSPSVITGAKELGVPVVLRLSDFFLLCPRFDFLCKGKVCEDCLSRGYFSCIRRRCVKHSLAASAIRVFSMRLHRLMKIYDQVDAFVTPTAFMKTKLIQNGFPAKKIRHIPTFTVQQPHDTSCPVGTYGLYFGRISEEKDVETVIRAYSQMPDRTLKIVGDDTTAEAQRLKHRVREEKLTNIEFAGMKQGEELEHWIRGARFSIVPSVWYENLPNTIPESFRFSKPVIASRIGSLPEIIHDGENGLLFAPGNEYELRDRIRLLDDDALVKRLGENGRSSLETLYGADVHYQKLINLFCEVQKQSCPTQQNQK